MNSFQVFVIENPAQERRSADTRREDSEADRDSPVTPKLLFGKVRNSVGHSVGTAKIIRELGLRAESIPRAVTGQAEGQVLCNN